MTVASMSKIDFKYLAHVVVSPVVFLIAIWVWQFLAHTFWNTGLDAPSADTWGTIIVGISGFAFGALIAYALQRGLPPVPRFAPLHPDSVSLLVRLSIPFAIIAAAILVFRAHAPVFEVFSAIKANLLKESAGGDKTNVLLVYVIIANIFCVIYYFNVAIDLNRWRSVLLIVVAAIISLFSGSRALLILFIVALIPALVFRIKSFSVKGVVLSVLGFAAFIAFFSLYPVLFQSADFGSDDNALRGYLSVYFFSGVSAFSEFLHTGHPSYNCLLVIPRPLIWVANLFYSGNGYVDCPTFFDESHVPLTTNVYTIFYPPMHDFGVVGVFLYLAVVGFMANFAYLRGFISGDSGWRFIYCIFFFSIFMSFFEDQIGRGALYYAIAIFVLIAARLLDRFTLVIRGEAV